MRRLALLLFGVVALTALAAGPAAGAQTATDGNETVLGAEIRGTTATNVSIPGDDADAVRATVAGELGVDEGAVRVAPAEDTVEVRAGSVSAAALREALTDAGLDASTATVRERVTERTQTETVTVVEERLSQAGIDATVEGVTTADGTRGVVVRTTDAGRDAVVENLTFEGRVAFVAHFPDGNGSSRDVTLLTNADFRNVGSAQPPSAAQPNPYVPVTLSDEAARNYSTAMQAFGFTGEDGIANCPTDDARQDPANASGFCLYTAYDGDVIFAAQMSAGLAQEIRDGDFGNDPRFVVTATNMSQARNLSLALRAGALPAPLAFDSLPEGAVRSDAGGTSAETDETTTSGDGAGFTAVAALAVVLALGAAGTRVGSR